MARNAERDHLPAGPEAAAAVKDLLERLVAQKVDPNRKRLFVIDGSKALRTAINAVFEGSESHSALQAA